MPNRDPGFVRLVDRLSGQANVDLDTGWSIHGREVAPFPEDPGQASAVRLRLQSGILEEASQAEYDELEESNKAIGEIHQPVMNHEVPFQEGLVRQTAAVHGEKLKRRRASAPQETPVEEESS